MSPEDASANSNTSRDGTPTRSVDRSKNAARRPTSRARRIAKGGKCAHSTDAELSPFHYCNRSTDERMFCRLKDFRRVATRYDRNAVTLLAAACVAAAVTANG